MPRNHFAIAVVTATMSDSAPEAEHEAPGRHHRERPAERRQRGAGEAQHAEEERGATGADAVDDDPADQHHHDVGEGVDGVQQADVRVGEAELRLEDVGQGADRVVDVVVPEHGQADQDEDGPAEGLRAARAGSRRSGSWTLVSSSAGAAGGRGRDRTRAGGLGRGRGAPGPAVLAFADRRALPHGQADSCSPSSPSTTRTSSSAATRASTCSRRSPASGSGVVVVQPGRGPQRGGHVRRPAPDALPGRAAASPPASRCAPASPRWPSRPRCTTSRSGSGWACAS